MQIKAKNIKKTYDKGLPTQFNALEGVSTTINQGEFISIIGQTGSGKTTFIEHMNALLIPDGGEMEFVFVAHDKKTNSEVERKINVAKKKFFKKKIKGVKEIRKRIGVVFQFAEYQLFERTIEKDIMFGAISMGVSKEEAQLRAKETIKMVGLPEEYLQKSPFDLSGGQKRRVAIAGILAMSPDIIFFDEPTAGLDPVGIRETLEIFNELYKSGKTIIISTHDLDNALTWTKRTIVFKAGQIIRDGDTYEILSDNNFLIKNKMQPTKLLSFVDKLRAKGMEIGKIRNIDELAEEINKRRK